MHDRALHESFVDLVDLDVTVVGCLAINGNWDLRVADNLMVMTAGGGHRMLPIDHCHWVEDDALRVPEWLAIQNGLI